MKKGITEGFYLDMDKAINNNDDVIFKYYVANVNEIHAFTNKKEAIKNFKEELKYGDAEFFTRQEAEKIYKRENKSAVSAL